MRTRTLMLTGLVVMLLGCSGIKDMLNGDGDDDGDADVHTPDDDDDPPPPPPPEVDDDGDDEKDPPAEDEWVTQTAQLEVAIEVSTGQRSKMMGIAREQLGAQATERGYSGVKKVRLGQIACEEVCKANATGEAWRKVKKSP
jgi:hypothetical protein